MNEQTQNDQPEGIVPQTPGDRPPDSSSARKFKLTWKFAVGFLGWYLVIGLIYVALISLDRQGYGNMKGGVFLVFPAQLIALVILFVVKQLRNIGWGMLSAIAVNLVISLILGFVGNAICFIPFPIRLF